jgi:hypothetical protein
MAGLASLAAMTLLGLSYWLWAENSYLQYKMEHPDFVRRPGALTEWVVNWLAQINASICILLGLLAYGLGKYTSSVRRTHRAPEQMVLLAFGLAGTTGVIVCGYSIIQMINAFIWEGGPHHLIDLILFLPPLVYAWLGLRVAWEAGRAHETFELGMAPIELAEEDRRAIRELILQFKGRQASRLYRKRTGAGSLEAPNAITAICKELARERPDFVAAVRRRQCFRGAVGLIFGSVILFVNVFLAPPFGGDMESALVATVGYWLVIAGGVGAIVAWRGSSRRRSWAWVATTLAVSSVLLFYWPIPAGLAIAFVAAIGGGMALVIWGEAPWVWLSNTQS